MSISFHDIFPAEIVSVQGKPFLFTNMRVNRKTVPEQCKVYDVADACDGEFWVVKPFVMVNHWCTIIGFDEVQMSETGAYYCAEDPDDPEFSSEGTFIGLANSFDQFTEHIDVFKKEAEKHESK